MIPDVRLYIRILLQVLLILAVTLSAIWGIASGRAIVLGSLGIMLTFILIGVLVHYLNTHGRRVRLFLDAMQDQETMFLFPTDRGNAEERRLHAAFNRVNAQLAELKLESCRQEHFYRALLQNIPGGVIAWDEGGQIRIANELALRLLECDSLQHRQQLERMIPDFGNVLREMPVNGSTVIRFKQSMREKQLSLSVSHIVVREEEITILALKDIGRELSSEEYRSWDKLAHVLTHEIMNSVAPVVSLSGTLLAYYQKDGVAKEADLITDVTVRKTIRGLDTIKRQGQGLMHFTDSFRRLSFLQAPVCKLFPLSRLLQNLQLLFQAEFEQQHIMLTVHSFPSEMEIVADEELLMQVLINLLKNAGQVLHGQENGTIVIRATKREMVVIEVADNGPGIAKELQDDIFIPFFTTKPQGTGIGLSISRQIIRMHGGDLQVSSEPFRETRFVITLPLKV